MNRLCILAALAACSAVAHGQVSALNINDGDVRFQINAASYSGASNTVLGGSSDFRVAGATGTDHLFRNLWAYRLDGHTREFMVNGPGAVFNFAGNTGTVDLTVAADSVRFLMTAVVQDTDGAALNAGRLTMTLLVQNLGNATRNVNLFNYVDWDINGSGGGDVGTGAVMSGFIEHTQTDVAVMTQRAYGANRWYNGVLVSSWFTNAVIDDYPNSAASIGPADLAQGDQWAFDLRPGASRSVAIGYAINATPVPEPASMIALGLGAAALLRRRRK